MENLAKGFMINILNFDEGTTSERHYALLPDGTVLESENLIVTPQDKRHFFGRNKKAVVSEKTAAWLLDVAQFIGNYRYSGHTIL